MEQTDKIVTRKCRHCLKEITGNPKKRFCSDSCRVYNHRDSKWVKISNLTKEQGEQIETIWRKK